MVLHANDQGAWAVGPLVFGHTVQSLESICRRPSRTMLLCRAVDTACNSSIDIRLGCYVRKVSYTIVCSSPSGSSWKTGVKLTIRRTDRRWVTAARSAPLS